MSQKCDCCVDTLIFPDYKEIVTGMDEDLVKMGESVQHDFPIVSVI